MKYILTTIIITLLSIVILFIYCSLILAKKTDRDFK